MTASAASPASSPRLPSPPPIAEDQLGPKSPIAATDEQQKLFSSVDHGAARRIRPGTKAEDMAEGPPLVDLSEIDSAFQLTEHLKALHNFLTHPVGSNNIIPVDREMAHKLAQPPENVDKTLWLYELCRFLTQKVNSIIVALFFDNPPCSSITCPEMRASEWQYLCAVHDPPKSCCAIDYCCHTLDWAANTLTSPKTFPSRLAMGSDTSTQHQQIRQLTNIFRRVYRIFAHAWFQHREMFWKVEGRTGLYILFKTVCDVYGLIPEDNYTIPPEAEGIEHTTEAAPAPPLILKREPSGPGAQDAELPSGTETVIDHSLSTGGTTKRHRHSPSVGAISVATVVEENEEEEEGAAKEEAPHVETSTGAPEGAHEEPAAQEPRIGEPGEEAPAEAAAAERETEQGVEGIEKQETSEAETAAAEAPLEAQVAEARPDAGPAAAEEEAPPAEDAPHAAEVKHKAEEDDQEPPAEPEKAEKEDGAAEVRTEEKEEEEEKLGEEAREQAGEKAGSDRVD